MGNKKRFQEEILSLWTVGPSGCFVPVDVLSHGRFVPRAFCPSPTDVLSPDVLSGYPFIFLWILQ